MRHHIILKEFKLKWPWCLNEHTVNIFDPKYTNDLQCLPKHVKYWFNVIDLSEGEFLGVYCTKCTFTGYIEVENTEDKNRVITMLLRDNTIKYSELDYYPAQLTKEVILK